MADNEIHRDEWKARFQAVSRAQARYLYVLLIAGAFYWALHVQVMSSPIASHAEQELPVVGVKVNAAVVWATAPSVLGFILLASLGTFHALAHASSKLGVLAKGDDSFECLDVVPTAIDFVVYTKSRWVSRFGCFSYPGFLTLVYGEAVWVWLSMVGTPISVPGRSVFLIVGAGSLLVSVPRLVGLWVSKGKKAFAS